MKVPGKNGYLYDEEPSEIHKDQVNNVEGRSRGGEGRD
jgi:hypothetical protein